MKSWLNSWYDLSYIHKACILYAWENRFKENTYFNFFISQIQLGKVDKKVDKKKCLMLIGFQDSTLEAHIVIFNTYFINTILVPKSPPVMKTT